MTSPTTDRRMGLVGNTAIKAPVSCATATAIMLSGEQSIDGVITSNSRVLVKAQADATTNGIYDSNSAGWTRSLDFNGTYDATIGTLIEVIGGSSYAGQFFVVAGTSPITIGSSAITFGPAPLAVGSLAAQLADTSNAANGDALIGVKSVLAGALARTQNDKNADIVSLADFSGIDMTGATDSSAGLAVASAYGGFIFMPPGTVKHNSTIVWANGTTLIGCGKRKSLFNYTGANDGHQINNQSNSTTSANSHFARVGFYSTGAVTAGKANFADNGSTYLTFDHCLFTGQMISLILDQTELAKVHLCGLGGNLSNASAIGLWLVNGADRTGGNAVGYTNNISILGCQFNNTAGFGRAIVDDGGISHTIDQNNNFNGWATHIRQTGTSGSRIANSEFEAATAANIIFDTTTLAGATVAPPICTVDTNLIQPAVGQTGINVAAAASLTILGNVISNTSNVTPSITVTNATSIVSLNNTLQNGYSGNATYHFARDAFTNPTATLIGGAIAYSQITLAYSASMTILAYQGNEFTVSVTNAAAHTFNAPTVVTTPPQTGQRISVTVRNAAGGAIATATWNAIFKMTAWIAPANGFSRTIDFKFDGTNWIEVARTAADVPN